MGTIRVFLGCNTTRISKKFVLPLLPKKTFLLKDKTYGITTKTISEVLTFVFFVLPVSIGYTNIIKIIS